MIGYRRFGHNETDEPAYTQPQMYARIKDHPPVRKLYADRLVADGVVSQEEAERMASEAYERVGQAHAELKESIGGPPDTGTHELDRTMSREPRTTVPEDTLLSLGDQLLRLPDGFELHRKLRPFLERRREALVSGGPIDWAHAETLAFASLLALGVPCSPRPARTRSAARSASATPSCTTRRPASATTRSSTCVTRTPRSSCTTARSPSRPAWASNTATASRRPTRSCSGRRSSVTS